MPAKQRSNIFTKGKSRRMTPMSTSKNFTASAASARARENFVKAF